MAGATIPKNVYLPAGELDSVLSLAITGHVYSHHSPLVCCCMESEMAMFRGALLADAGVDASTFCQSRPKLWSRNDFWINQLEKPEFINRTKNFIINHRTCEWFIVVAQSLEENPIRCCSLPKICYDCEGTDIGHIQQEHDLDMNHEKSRMLSG